MLPPPLTISLDLLNKYKERPGFELDQNTLKKILATAYNGASKVDGLLRSPRLTKQGVVIRGEVKEVTHRWDDNASV